MAAPRLLTITILSVLVASTLTVQAAKKEFFTRKMQRQFDIVGSNLKKVQFYTSKTITLERRLGSGEKGVSGGKIVSRSGVRINQVIVKAKTPGILERDSGRSLYVSFEEGTQFNFVSDGNSGGSFCLAAREWRSGIGHDVDFNGQEWKAVNGSGGACLTVDTKSLLKVDKDKRKLKGRKVK